jgi:CDP-diglyceride synthetase
MLLILIPKETDVMDYILRKPLNDFVLRLITTLFSIPIVIFIVNKGTPYIDILASLVVLGLWREWNRLVNLPKRHPGFLGGVLYIGLAVGILIFFGHKSPLHKTFLLWLLAVVWATDIGAYVVGRTLKGPKLSKSISPNKTWSGFFGGVGAACLCSFLFNHFLPVESLFSWSLLLITVAMSVAAHGGDLLESWVKRYFGVKDAGTLLPGHGGLLDRLDSLLLIAILSGVFYWGGIIH